METMTLRDRCKNFYQKAQQDAMLRHRLSIIMVAWPIFIGIGLRR